MSHEVPKGIQSISKADIHRITSGQVVLDIQSAVKELIENALDAGAKAIEVRFKEYGADLIEVIDNGCGIGAENYESLALKHHTSKLSNFQDLTSVRTFGFRGEALSSLCELCKVQVVTAVKEEEPVGTVLELNRDGTIKSQDKKVARQRGTTVSLEELFVTLPVRRRELLKNVKREFAKAQALLQAYAIISKGVRWVVSNTVKGKRNNIMTITGSDSPSFIRNNVSAVFGAKACTPLIPLDLEIPVEETRIAIKKGRPISDQDEDMNEESGVIKVQGLISRPTHGSGRASSDRVFLYLNGRPWDSARIIRAFNEVYKSFNHNQMPMVISNFTIEGERYDVNVSPDKRTLFLHDEAEIIEGLKIALEEHLSPFQSTFTVNGANLSAAKDAAMQSQLPYKMVVSSSSSQLGTQLKNDLRRRSSSQQEDEEESIGDAERLIRSLKRQRTQQHDADSRDGVLQRATSDDEINSNTISSRESTVDVEQESPIVEDRQNGRANAAGRMIIKSQGRNASPATIESKLTGPKSPVKMWDAKVTAYSAALSQQDLQAIEATGQNSAVQQDPDTEDLEYLEEGLTAEQRDEALQRSQEYKDSIRQEMNLAQEEMATENEEREANLALLDEEAQNLPIMDLNSDSWKREMINQRERTDGSTSIKVDISTLRKRLQDRAKSSVVRVESTRKGQSFDLAGVEESDIDAIESTLSRSIDKIDFDLMEIIGQFNLGFILARRRKLESEEDDLFIIDQHAADEKYNFEILQSDTILQSQTLIRPRTLELPSSVEMVAAQHIETLASHGFVVKVNAEAMPGARVELYALPISKNTTFGVADLEELLHRLEDVTPNSARAKAIRCSKLYNMLASRACRKSVMIGRALTYKQMKVVLHHMGEIDQPWNCPHGRPTMRHLHQLDVYPDDALNNRGDAIKWQALL